MLKTRFVKVTLKNQMNLVLVTLTNKKGIEHVFTVDHISHKCTNPPNLDSIELDRGKYTQIEDRSGFNMKYLSDLYEYSKKAKLDQEHIEFCGHQVPKKKRATNIDVSLWNFGSNEADFNYLLMPVRI